MSDMLWNKRRDIERAVRKHKDIGDSDEQSWKCAHV